jgi:hypothetical protein
MSDDEIRDEALAALATIAPAGVSVPAPAEVMVTRWHSDPWTLGSYSHVRPGQPGAHTALATPLQNTVYFAGGLQPLIHLPFHLHASPTWSTPQFADTASLHLISTTVGEPQND